MNIIKIQDQLRGVPDNTLVGYVQNPTGQVPTYLALSELQRRKEMRSKFQEYLENNEVALNSRRSYMKWMYGLLSELASSIRVSIPTYKGYVARVMYFKSGCQKKSYKGKTCRTMKNGFRTKDRDHKRTFRITRETLLNG